MARATLGHVPTRLQDVPYTVGPVEKKTVSHAPGMIFGGSVAYDFGYASLSGLSAGAWYTQGWGALDPVTNFAIPDRSELDLWIQYRPSEGPQKGLRVKTQYVGMSGRTATCARRSRNFGSSSTTPFCSGPR